MKLKKFKRRRLELNTVKSSMVKQSPRLVRTRDDDLTRVNVQFGAQPAKLCNFSKLVLSLYPETISTRRFGLKRKK